MRTALRVALPFALSAVAACGDVSRPSPHDVRIYALESVGGNPLPFLVDSSATQWDVVVWDSLKIDFTADTTFETRNTVHHYPRTDSQEDETWSSDKVAVHGDSVLLTPRDGVSSRIVREGLVDTSMISLQAHLPATPNPEYVYRSVSGSP